MASLSQMRVAQRSTRIAQAQRAVCARKSVVVRASSSIADLNSKFGISGSVEVIAGRGGLPTVQLKHTNGYSAEVTLFGACVTSFKQTSGDEVLYIRPDAVFDKSKPISGGIPHCFPQFGPGKMQQHGFARNLDWTISSTSADPNPDEKEPEVELTLTESEYTLKMFPHKFKAVYTITLRGEELATEFNVINTDDKPFDFTAALHTYIEVAHINQARVTGLKGLTYLDKSVDPKNPEKKTESRDAITFDAYMDHVYLDAPSNVQLEVGTGAAVALEGSGWSDVVVWNPWTTMKDSYEHFVCVENAKAGAPVILQPGQSWKANMTMSVVDLKQ